jgi:ferredoxin
MTKILLRFSEALVSQPITSHIILDLGLPLNILNANVTPKGGEILVEVHAKDLDSVLHAFQEKGVVVVVQEGVTVERERCIDCGACYSVCPVNAISFEEDYLVHFDAEKCISCALCVDACPTRAISV